MDVPLEVFFDYRSPFAYLLSEILPARVEPLGARIVWKPIDLLQLSSFSQGLPYSDKKRAYVYVDAARQAQFHGVPIEVPEPFPVDSGLALRAALVAADRPGFAAAHRALFHAAWRERRDLSDRQVVVSCLRAGSVDPEPCLDEAGRSGTSELLFRRTRDADDAGVFGVPTASLRGELFWGLDSLPALEWRLRGGAQAAT